MKVLLPWGGRQFITEFLDVLRKPQRRTRVTDSLCCIKRDWPDRMREEIPDASHDVEVSTDDLSEESQRIRDVRLVLQGSQRALTVKQGPRGLLILLVEPRENYFLKSKCDERRTKSLSDSQRDPRGCFRRTRP